MSKIIKIAMLTAVLAAMMTVTCFAEDASEETAGVTRAVNSVMEWIIDNPAAVFSAIITGVSGGFCLGGGVSNRKTRKEVETNSTGLTSAATTINNNAVELANKVKTDVINMVGTVKTELQKFTAAITGKADELVQAIHAHTVEIKALRRETKANSFLIRELLKDARLPQRRKDDIERDYKNIVEGGEVVNDDSDQA